MIILLTCYNRLSTLKRTIESLMKCKGIKYIPIYYYQDYKEFDSGVEEVSLFLESILRNIDDVHYRTVHHGLLMNTEQAIKELIQKDDLIWLQDDMEFSEDFLEFMQYAMNEYRNDEEIMFVSGYTHITHHSLYLSPFISEALGIWKHKFDSNFINKNWAAIISNTKLMQQYEKYSSTLYVDLLKSAVINEKDVIGAYLNYEMFSKNSYCLHPNKNKLKHLISNSLNCKVSTTRRLNQELLEGYSRRLDTGEANIRIRKEHIGRSLIKNARRKIILNLRKYV